MSDSSVVKPAPLASDFPIASPAEWRRLIDKALKGADFNRRLVARTADGIGIEPLFTTRPEAADGAIQPERELAGPAWDIRQLHAGSDAAQVNAAILEDLAGGASSITLQIATASQNGLSAQTTDMARALDSVLLDVCPIALRAGEQAPAAAACLVAIWQQRGLSNTQRIGAFNYDPLGALAATGGLSVPLSQALETAADMVKQSLPWPQVSALCASGPVWHDAGASEAQELAAVLATVVAYLRAAEAKGVLPADALPKIALQLAVDADQLMGLAKLRAARQLIARVADACGAAPAAGRVPVTAETSRAMMTRPDPWVNMLRTTMACATAAMGGADCITVLPYTWALGQPDAFARRMARNTSIVLMEESGLGRVSDPASGSFAVETLTAELEKTAWSLFQDIEAQGGLGAVINSGWWQEKITRIAAQKHAAIATGKVQLTGTSAFPRLGDDGVTVTPWPPVLQTQAAAGGTRVQPLQPFRPSEPFERLRDRMDAHAQAHGKTPVVFLACLGPLASYAARATWTSNFLAAGGIAAVQSAPLLQSVDAGPAFAASGATIACLCGADETYAEIGEATAALLRTAGARQVYTAGRLKDQEAALQAAGVDRFIYAGSEMIETLTEIQDALGVAGEDA